MSLVWFGMVEETCKTSKVDFHMVWTQVDNQVFCGFFLEGGGGCLRVVPPTHLCQVGT